MIGREVFGTANSGWTNGRSSMGEALVLDGGESGMGC